MLKRILKQKRFFKNIYKEQKGITGLETAIILIAFVVVAAVFAYTVLSAGLFSTQKSQEAVYAGLKETQGTLEILGGVVGYKDSLNTSGGGSIGRIDFTIALATDGTSVDLTPSFDYDNSTSDGDGATYLTQTGVGLNRLQIAFNDQDTTLSDVAWTATFIGKNNVDTMLDPGEKAIVSVWLHCQTGAGTWTNVMAGTGTADEIAETQSHFIGSDFVDTYHTFTLEVKPTSGATLTIQRTTPAFLDSIVDMH
jgi:archaeal flagellin FlaB